tara:strand:+ start:1102 stop:1449 length:348 start_codon:yes stop_codon:yes gene_type:complete
MELTERQLAVLNHVVENGQAWADNAKKESHVLEKIAKYESAYDEAVAKGNYKTRKQIDDANDQARKDAYDNVSWDVKRQREYPSVKELVIALYDTDDKAELMQRRADVKKKYPKP